MNVVLVVLERRKEKVKSDSNERWVGEGVEC
jgi:hypothetical protein